MPPSKTQVLAWLRGIKEPWYKIEASKILASYLVDISRSKYLETCLSSLKNDAHRQVFLREHQFIDMSAEEVAVILQEFSSYEGKRNALLFIMETIDRKSRNEIKGQYCTITSLFTSDAQKMKIYQIIMSS
jgi:hypothetical protein